MNLKTVEHFALLTLLSFALAGCFPLTIIPIPVEKKTFEIAYSFNQKDFVHGGILLTEKPRVFVRVRGCGLGSCLPSHPLAFDLVAAQGVKLVLPTAPILIIGERRIPVFVRDEISNYDKLRHINLIVIDAKVEELNGAQLKLGALEIDGQSIERTDIWISCKVEVTTEIVHIPSEWK